MAAELVAFTAKRLQNSAQGGAKRNPGLLKNWISLCRSERVSVFPLKGVNLQRPVATPMRSISPAPSERSAI
jgi:hypothetical protein